MPSLAQRLARLRPYLRPGRRGLIGAGLGALVGAATEPAIPALLKPLLDEGFGAERSWPLWWVPVLIVGLFTLRGLAGFVAQYGLAWAAQRAVLALRQDLFAHLLASPSGLFTRQSASQLTNTVVYEVQQGATLLINALLTLAKDSLTLVALLVYLLWLNWQLTLLVGLLFPALAVVMRHLGRRLRRLTVAGQQATDELAYVVEENVLAWRIVRLHGAEPAQASRFGAQGERLRRLMMKVVASSAAITPLTQVLAACALSTVIVLALWQSQGAGGTVGGFVAFITAMLMIVSPLRHLADVVAPITRGLAAIERGLDLMADMPREAGGTHDGGRARGEIVLQDVTLRYRDDGLPALDRLTLTVRAGETVALVGPSGAGKSTVVNLLPRFVEAGEGRVLLDGVPVGDWDAGALRRQFALVSQDVVLFNDTVAANVALGADVPHERIREALAGAQLLDFVDGLPQGLDTVIGHNGSQLSGGQRQRLAIARAICKDAPVLILDEATSALDTESERGVQAALEVLMRGRTTLIVAHRLSTIEHADRVVVIEGGRVAEQGPHAALIAQGGLYARLHAMQFKT
ncbi:lipid A export permease/ATP-binding protein MsbA [Rubrivivax albus]|uniref:Lipid A export permease/ATP-binding protein MsbA n=1 Tax=Rubrivivax albus TaxID=2499835 RepID=A0A437JRY0_9BURK|nr:lipid A export permease/ATP-binding protein MsbA [Rubrivivax albus]RVT49665.1 lipid A export permease/ATP-binding protein MsbA [Rubrivivax albus]